MGQFLGKRQFPVKSLMQHISVLKEDGSFGVAFDFPAVQHAFVQFAEKFVVIKEKNHTTPLTAKPNAYMDAITSAKRNALLCALKVKFSIFLAPELSPGTSSLIYRKFQLVANFYRGLRGD